MGDIGEPQREVTFEPLEAPEPLSIPEPAAPEPATPTREPVPA